MSDVRPESGPFRLWWLVVLSALLAYSTGLAIGPRVTGDDLRAKDTPWGVNCLLAIDLPGPFGLNLNCDSSEFMRVAADPQRLFEPGNVRQSRPLQAWVVWLLAQPVRLASDWIVAFSQQPGLQMPEGQSRTRAQALVELVPSFLGFYLLNLCLLLGAVALVRFSAKRMGWSLLVTTLCCASLLFNDITKAFLITPHSQLMNIILPVMLGGVFLHALRGQRLHIREGLGLAALGGLAALAYATWVLLPVVVAGVLGWQQLRQRAPSHEPVWLRRLWLPLLVLLALGPVALWVQFVDWRVGHYYEHAVTADGGLIWMTQGTVFDAIAAFAGHLSFLCLAALKQLPPYVMMAVPAVVALLRWPTPMSVARRADMRASLYAAGLVALLFLLFFSLLGFRIWRYAVPMLPALVFPLVVLNMHAWDVCTTRGAQRPYLWAIATAGALMALGQVVKNGPWC